ncbi:hypothetical protein CVU37_08570 [candidate division BRC1 bacterium HGW-BRC1-1]|jgi:hypothetical protein|nr:MAG: hypothetical protein CVU37_08570 [candidate division BRC1 bacterium HGW-BRC1-1]
MVGVIGFATALALKNARDLTRATHDRVNYEEAYHVAMGGLSAAKAWVMNPALAKAQLGQSAGAKIEAVTSGSIAFSNYVRENRDNSTLLDAISAGGIVSPYYSQYDSSLASGAGLSGGRKVLLDLPVNASRVIDFHNDMEANYTGTIFHKSGTPVPRAYVRRIRISTPYRSTATDAAGLHVKDDLRRVSLIIEAESVISGVGPTKSRIMQQKILIQPGTSSMLPPIQGSDSALISGHIVTVSGNSSLNIHWAPVMAKGNLELLGIAPLEITKKDNYELAAKDNKYTGAGVGTEKWLRYLTAAKFVDKSGSGELFPSSVFPAGSPQITDVLVQTLNGAFDVGSKPLNRNTLSLTGDFYVSNIRNGTGQGVLYSGPTSGGSNFPLGSGAFVQNWPATSVYIDSVMNNMMNYNTWKAFAIQQGGYCRPGTGGGFVNDSGQPLYVTPSGSMTTVATHNTRFTELRQISMKNLVPSNGNTSQIPDRILFIDTIEGTQNGTYGNIAMNSSDNWFWKGLLYLNSDFSTSGGGGFPSVLMKNPDQFAADPSGSTGTNTAGCYMDGILYVAGTMGRTGNASVYGTIIAKGGYGGSGSPDIYYNSRLKEGLFKNVMGGGSGLLAAAVSGPIQELNLWVSTN